MISLSILGFALGTVAQLAALFASSKFALANERRAAIWPILALPALQGVPGPTPLPASRPGQT